MNKLGSAPPVSLQVGKLYAVTGGCPVECYVCYESSTEHLGRGHRVPHWCIISGTPQGTSTNVCRRLRRRMSLSTCFFFLVFM